MADGNGSALARSHSVKDIPQSFEKTPEKYQGSGGLCDVAGKAQRTQLQEIRYSCFLFTFTNGVIAADTQLRAFAEGIDDTGVSLGWGSNVTLTQAQTNLFANGSLNNSKDGAFVGRSVGFAFGRPFVYTAATGARAYSVDTDYYAARAARTLAEVAEFTLLQRDAQVSLLMGLSFQWPSAQQIAECNFPTLDKPIGTSVLVPLLKEWEFIDDNKGNNSFVDAAVKRQLTLTSDPGQPIPASLSVPLWVTFYGGVAAASEACATPNSGDAGDPVERVQQLITLGYSRDAAMSFVRDTYSKR